MDRIMLLTFTVTMIAYFAVCMAVMLKDLCKGKKDRRPISRITIRHPESVEFDRFVEDAYANHDVLGVRSLVDHEGHYVAFVTCRLGKK